MKIFLAEYGVATTIPFSLFEVDGVDFRVDAVHVSGDTFLTRNEGAEANTTNGFVDEGSGYSLSLTATEMQTARIHLFIVDQTATKIWLDTDIVIMTFGNASAQVETFPVDVISVAGTTQTANDNGADINAILVDTDELQTNQGNWLTATGFSTHSAADIWAVTTRTLSRFVTLVADIWANITRTITGTVTTDTASRDASKADVSGLAIDSTVAKEATVSAIPTTPMRGTDAAALAANLAAMQIDVTKIFNYSDGNWEIVNNQMIFKDDTNVEIDRFDLTKAGVPDSDSPDKREKV